jgi:hypothetical protein
MPVDLRRLRYFVAVAEERSVGRAAERLRMAQPPLSVQIRKLESEVGASLFRRGTRGMELTEAGQALLSRASEALALAAEGAEAARAVAAGRRGRLSVGYMFVLAHAALPRLVPKLRRSTASRSSILPIPSSVSTIETTKPPKVSANRGNMSRLLGGHRQQLRELIIANLGLRNQDATAQMLDQIIAD